MDEVRQYLAQLRDAFERAVLEALPDVRSQRRRGATRVQQHQPSLLRGRWAGSGCTLGLGRRALLPEFGLYEHAAGALVRTSGDGAECARGLLVRSIQLRGDEHGG